MNISEIERLRKKLRNRIIKGIVISLSIGIGIFLLTKIILMSTVFVCFGGVITLLFSKLPYIDFATAYKEVFVMESLKQTFNSLEYEPANSINPAIIQSTGTIKMGDKFDGEDYISGYYKSVYFVQSDITIQKVTHTSDGTDYHTMFNGRWIIFDISTTSFIPNIVIVQKGLRNIQPLEVFIDRGYVKLFSESLTADRKYTIYADKRYKKEAYDFLSQSMMDRIKRLSGSIKGRLIFCFKDNKLHIGVSTSKNSFEPSIFHRCDSIEASQRICQDIMLITNFVDEMC